MKMICLNITLGSAVVILTLTLINCQLESPCANVLQYRYGTAKNDKELYGLIEVPLPNDKSNVIKLEVQISVGNVVENYNGNIQLGAPRNEIVSDLVNGRPLRYILYFPTWFNIQPRVTKILVNGRQVCSGSPIDRSSVSVITTIDLQHSLTITSSPQSQDNSVPWLNSLATTSKPQENSNTQTSFFSFGSIFGNQNYPQNSFLNQIFSGNQPELGSLIPNALPSNQNSQLPSFQFQFGTPPKSTKEKIPTSPNKFGTESNSNSLNPPKNKQPNDLPTIESNFVTQPSQRTSDICGISVNSNRLLINGNLFQKGLHPWIAALFMQNDEGLKFICGSSLISQRHVVTAAHCVRNKRRKLNPEELWVVLGRENIQRWSNDGAQIIQAASTHFYPDHQFHTADADIGLIVLSEDVVFSSLVKPVCLWNTNPELNRIVGQNGTVVGWGKDESGKVFTPRPRLVTMPIASEESCLRSHAGFREITSNRTFCAGNRDNSGPCNGDSGSGFVIYKLGRWYLRGVVSMSLLGPDGSCDLRQYIVFTDVAKYIDWIKSFLS